MPDKKQIGGVNWELANDSAREWARRHSAQLVGGILDTTRDKIRRNVADFVENQRTFGELTANIQASGAFNQARANLIAVTETTGSYAEGNMVAWKESGVTEATMWNTNNDSLVCTICGPLDGVVVPLGSEFDGGGEGPPAHPGCRCWLTPRMLGDTETRADIDATYGLERMPGIGAPSVPMTQTSPAILPFEDAQTANQLGSTFDSISQVHDIPEGAEVITVKGRQKGSQGGMYDDQLGVYRYGGKANIPLDIVIRTDIDGARSTLMHEYGHFVDHQLISGQLTGEAGNWVLDIDHPAASQLKEAIESSENITRRRLAYADSPTDWKAYHLQNDEIFARSYNQYIATKTGDLDALMQIDRDRAEMFDAWNTQWRDEDFIPISSAMDNLFKVLGWLR